ncbi:MAG: hypothetical protein HKN45_07505 [Flavobacteriales bacterium]|nr:hypothetical protein [Flavobacteriales bacterium]
MRLSAGLLLCTLLIACTGDSAEKRSSSSDTQDWISHISGTEIFGKEIGSASLRSSKDSLIVLSTQQQGPKELRAEWKVDDGILMEIRLRCSFDSLLDPGYSSLEEHFRRLYGPHKPTIGYSSWKTSSADGRLVEVELIDGQILYGRNEVIAHWNVHEDRLYED